MEKITFYWGLDTAPTRGLAIELYRFLIVGTFSPELFFLKLRENGI